MEKLRNTGKLSSEELHQYVVDNIDRAVEEGFIKVFYQPVARTLTREICGMEALARWDDPDYGLLAPNIFIGALEESRQIHKLDICVIKQICQDYARSMNENERIVTVSFNLSRLDFQLCDIHGIIEDAIRTNRVPREAFRVEITESMMESDEERMHDVIDRFWERGLRVWMDDFGSGYSSLNVLKDYRFDTLKIDMIFLRNFNVRSQEIVKSVVDMAKRIGVHTLAEGVETLEQLEFLRNIGCEKAQGYYIGKPMPYGECRKSLEDRGYQMESIAKRQYYHEIGKINILSATPLIPVDDNSTQPTYRERQIPLAFVEFSQKRIKYIFANEAYRETLKSVGIDSEKEVEKMFGFGDNTFGEKFLQMMTEADESEDIVSSNFIRNGCYCYSQVRAIASYPGGKAYLCILQNLSTDALGQKSSLLAENLHSLCSIFDRIELVDLESGYSTNLYNNGRNTEKYNKRPAKDELADYAESEIYLADRKRFLKFVDLDTVEERLKGSRTNFTSEPFRLKTVGGSYAWELFMFANAGKPKERKVLCCMRRLEAFFYPFVENHFRARFGDEALDAGAAPDYAFYSNGVYATGVMPNRAFGDSGLKSAGIHGEITDGLLWRNFILYGDTPFFWKDKNRKFLGANRKFLEYYGMDSVDALIGKNDEEVGWHINPSSYKADEEHVLETGEATFLVPGTCIKDGQARDIVASKIPLYRNGEIVGLMGYFLDVEQHNIDTSHVNRVSIYDPFTGGLNFLGLINSALRYQESYAFNHIDFAMIVLDVVHFRTFNQFFGLDWGNKLLREIGDALREVMGVEGIAGRVNSDNFLVIRKFEGKAEIEDLIQKIHERMEKIREIDGISCTVYLRAGYAVYSEVKELEALFRLASKRMNKEEKD